MTEGEKTRRRWAASSVGRVLRNIFKARPGEWISVGELANLTDTRPITPYIHALRKVLRWNIENRQWTEIIRKRRVRCSEWCYTPGPQEREEAA